jgi:N-acetylmuramoyl-L-alanine amidase
MKTVSKIAESLGILSIALLLSFAPATDKKRIVIDAGHGGHDTGQSVNELTESAINLQIAKRIQAIAEQEGLEVILLRDDDTYTTLNERAESINALNPDLLISIHINSDIDGTTEMGNRMFIHDKESTKAKSIRLAGKLALAMSAETDFKDTQITTANLAVLRLTNCPSVLMNIGNIKNKKERDYVTSAAGQEAIARAVVAAVGE